jgi:CRISPR-associated protein Cmr6
MTSLQRTQIQPLFKAAAARGDFHAGLMLQRGWADYGENGDNADGKTAHLKRICAIGVSEVYQRAYERWERATKDTTRFSQHELKLVNRLLIGLASTGSLETGCAISHTWGMPYIPGSSVKGVVRAYAEKTLGKDNPLVREMFGAAHDSADKEELSGVVAFHDAWWLPKGSPFVPEVLTVHHTDYYTKEGETPASDKDSPVPVSLLAVEGKFLFVIEGPPAWARQAGKWLEAGLVASGIGAKTRSGYGYFEKPKESEILAEVWENGKLFYNPGKKEIYGHSGSNKTAPVSVPAQVEAFFTAISDDLASRLKKKKMDGVGGLKLEVEKQGNLFRLIRVLTS